MILLMQNCFSNGCSKEKVVSVVRLLYIVVDYSCAENNFGFITFQVNPRFPGGKDIELSRVKREAC